MALVAMQLVADCSIVAKWKLAGEPQAAEAEELYRDWMYGTVNLVAPYHLRSELLGTFLRAWRRGRVTQTEAADSIRDLLSLPFAFHEVSVPLALRALEIACRHNQAAHDTLYVALAEQENMELWTGDRRLFNALNVHYSFLRWLGDYQRQRP